MTQFSPVAAAGSGQARARRVTAVLGPTNTGKTHLAIERMLGHSSGIIGLPLRLLAREVYNTRRRRGSARTRWRSSPARRRSSRRNARYWVATVEAMPRDLDVAFVAVDEIQLAADLDRGHVFTDRLLNRRGRDETMLIGASTMRPLIERLLPGRRRSSRGRACRSSPSRARRSSRACRRRTAIVAFSAEEVYAIAELIRRQRGGAAVVLGALSPRTRNAQVEMYQAGEVDFIVATDAIGMGLNLDVDHVAFAGDRKFDGWQYRRLTPAEFGQIAGRAGRHLQRRHVRHHGPLPALRGRTGRGARRPPLRYRLPMLQWRNADLDFSSIDVAAGLARPRYPSEPGLTRAPMREDVMVLDIAARDERCRQARARPRPTSQRLWEVCQVPDYRKVSPAAHADLVATLFGFIVRARADSGRLVRARISARSTAPMATSTRCPRASRRCAPGTS